MPLITFKCTFVVSTGQNMLSIEQLIYVKLKPLNLHISLVQLSTNYKYCFYYNNHIVDSMSLYSFLNSSSFLIQNVIGLQ